MEGKIRLAVFGQKRLSREGGIEIVVKELCTRMAQKGCDITCYNRAGHHVSGAEYDKTIEYAGAHKTPKLTVSNSCEIKCVALVRMIYRDMRWNRNNTYRLEGKNVPRQQLVSFDLDIPFLVENGKALDENPSPTKPLCGEEVSAAESSSVSPIKRNSGAM